MIVLPDVLESGLTTIFCGSAASSSSAREDAYYAGPGNRFWTALLEAGFTPYMFKPRDFRELRALGVGLTDLAKHEFGVDASLSSTAYNSELLLEKIETTQPLHLAFTGKRPAGIFLLEILGAVISDYGLQKAQIGMTKIYVLPSPSGAAVRWWSPDPWIRLGAIHCAAEQGRDTK
jgi:TDG/mug DNA glycosylase family protein